MRILIIGGGPGGLYTGLLLKKANPAYDVQIVERNPANATYGWGVVFSDRTLTSFREADYPTFQEISDHFVIWYAIDTYYRGQVVRCDGHSFAGLSRRVLLNILQNRCLELGVDLAFESTFTDLERLADFDLVIAADGINSMIRQAHTAVFKPSLEVGQARYIWFGTDKVLDAFTFVFRQNEHGLFQAHAYPFDGRTSTFIVECEEAVWQRAGLDRASEAETIAYCHALFADFLDGRSLMSNKSEWHNFVTVKNKTWRHGNIVLLGDAAHTAHFSIGSGTKLAMEDAIALANAFARHSDTAVALNEYEMDRRPVVEALQTAAQESQIYFENIKRYLHLEPLQFATHLLTRSGRITYDNLRLRDPYFIDHVDRFFRIANMSSSTNQSTLPPLIAPPPMFIPLKLRGLTVTNRIVISPVSTGTAVNGLPNKQHRRQLINPAQGGVGLLLTEPTAVSADGRISCGCAGMYDETHLAAWREIVTAVHEQTTAKIALQLNHAGRRGSTRPRREGLDRPLPEGNWPLWAASPLAYTPYSQIPRPLEQPDMERVRDDFVRAATLAHEAGFDMLQLHFAQGYLLAGFISPLTNQREDEYGGSLENRLRFPLTLFEAVRAAWPAEKPLAVAIPATDWYRGGLTVADGVKTAVALKARGCDLVELLAGQTVANDRPVYGLDTIISHSDHVRHEAAVPTLARGYITTSGQVNSILAAGRADLCVMEFAGEE